MGEARDWKTSLGGSEGKSSKERVTLRNWEMRAHDFQGGMIIGYFKDKGVLR